MYFIILEPILGLVVKKYVWIKLGLFFPARVVKKLTTIPDNGFMEFIKVNSDINGLGQSLPLLLNIALAIGYSVIFYLIARAILQKRDL